MLPWKTSPLLAIDTETSGPDPASDVVVELGCVRFRAGRVLERRGMLLNPGRPIPAEATAVHGISDADVADAPTLASVADRFLAIVRSAPILVAYNAGFDFAILERELGQPWLDAIAGRPVLDPLVVVRKVGRYWKNGPEKGRHKLVNVAQRLGVVADRGHRATGDCVTTCRVLVALAEHLPECAHEAAAMLAEMRVEQERDYQEWLAKQPPKETAA